MKTSINILKLVAGLILLIVMIASNIERVMWIKATNIGAASYSNTFVNKNVHFATVDEAFEFTSSTCTKRTSDIVDGNHTMYVRCGNIWPFSKVTKITIDEKIELLPRLRGAL